VPSIMAKIDERLKPLEKPPEKPLTVNVTRTIPPSAHEKEMLEAMKDLGAAIVEQGKAIAELASRPVQIAAPNVSPKMELPAELFQAIVDQGAAIKNLAARPMPQPIYAPNIEIPAPIVQNHLESPEIIVQAPQPRLTRTVAIRDEEGNVKEYRQEEIE